MPLEVGNTFSDFSGEENNQVLATQKILQLKKNEDIFSGNDMSNQEKIATEQSKTRQKSRNSRAVLQESIVKVGGDEEQQTEGFTLGLGRDTFVQYLKNGFGIKSKDNGVKLTIEPKEIGERSSLSGTVFTQFMPEKEKWKFSSNIEDIRTLTFAIEEVTIENPDAEKIQGYSVSVRNRETKQGINENSLTFGWSSSRLDSQSIRVAFGKVIGEYQEQGYSQNFGIFEMKKMFQEVIYRASGYIIQSDQLGDLEDGSTVFIGEAGDPLVFNKESEVQKTTLHGLDFSTQLLLQERQAALNLNLQIAKNFSEQFHQYSAKYSQIFHNGERKWHIEMKSDGKDLHKLELGVSKFFDSFGSRKGKDGIEVRAEVSYETGDGDGLDGKLEIRYSGKQKYKTFGIGIDPAIRPPSFDRLSES